MDPALTMFLPRGPSPASWSTSRWLGPVSREGQMAGNPQGAPVGSASGWLPTCSIYPPGPLPAPTSCHCPPALLSLCLGPWACPVCSRPAVCPCQILPCGHLAPLLSSALLPVPDVTPPVLSVLPQCPTGSQCCGLHLPPAPPSSSPPSGPASKVPVTGGCGKPRPLVILPCPSCHHVPESPGLGPPGALMTLWCWFWGCHVFLP